MVFFIYHLFCLKATVDGANNVLFSFGLEKNIVCYFYKIGNNHVVPSYTEKIYNSFTS